VYGLTKGQFSPSATSLDDQARRPQPDPADRSDSLGLSLGATFLARGFSGDKQQLVPIIKAAGCHRGWRSSMSSRPV